MSPQVSLPLDSDGFLRRQCPTCDRQFKWHDGPANEQAEGQAVVSAYFCPICGDPALVDQWWTSEQVQHINGVALPAALQGVNDELDSMFRGMNSKNFRITKKGQFDIPDEPDPLMEPDDMMIIASPCHAWEPVKVPEGSTSPFYCLVCGRAFAV